MLDSIAWIKKHIERASLKWPPLKQAENKASRVSLLSDKRTKFEYQCNHCKEWFRRKDINRDHIVPKGRYSRETFFDWLDKLLCPASGIQILCIPCHVKKSASEHADGSYK
jgi:hypothetical protein